MATNSEGSGVPNGEDDREVTWTDDLEILPDQTRDDTDRGWGESRRRADRADDQRLLEDRPPHWG